MAYPHPLQKPQSPRPPGIYHSSVSPDHWKRPRVPRNPQTYPFPPRRHLPQPIILGQQRINPSQHPRHPSRYPRPHCYPSQHPGVRISHSSCATSTTLLLWNRHLHVQSPTTEHSPNAPIYLSLGPQRIPTSQNRTTLSASHKLYSIWLTDLVQHQQPQKADAPHFVVPDPSSTAYLEETHPEEPPHLECLLPCPQPRPHYPQSQITLPLFTRLWQHLHQYLFCHHPVPTPAPRT